MATSAAAAILDQLMGRTRNFDPNERPPELQWEDDAVCKYFLCGFCPHELFTNTRADLGVCNKIHEEALRKQYQESSRFERMGYEEEFLHSLQSLISDVDKRIRRGHQRLALNNSLNTVNGNALSEKEENINILTDKINELVNQAEELGSEGKVEEAQDVLKLCDQLKEEHTQIQNQPVKDDQVRVKKMEVCEVCGAFLIIDDVPQRQGEHVSGKQHAGYARVRSEIEKRKMQKKMVLDEREQKRQQELEEQEKAVEREREARHRQEKDRESRDRRDRRDRDHERDRHRDKKRRSRSRSEGHRSRERRRSGSHERHRYKHKRRSRSRSDQSRSSHRSRSRSRAREKSSSRRDRDCRKETGDRYSKSQSKDWDWEKRYSSSVEKDERSSAEKDKKSSNGHFEDGHSQSQGDT